MLSKFTVSNFKNFKEPFTFSLEEAKNYSFNASAVKEGIVQNAIVYGYNGVGKSNLGLALFDIVGHLTDKHTDAENSYGESSYLNAYNKTRAATFKYEFLFGRQRVTYSYEKKSFRLLLKEQLIINDQIVAEIDRSQGTIARIELAGAESLNKELNNPNLSLLKYIQTNANLIDSLENRILAEFFDFVNKMLFYRSLSRNLYLGYENGAWDIETDIIKKGKLKDFELFLNEKANLDCRLEAVSTFDKIIIAFDFDGVHIPFYDIASTGTQALALFYAWSLRLRSEQPVSFLFIDEFDAFYHHELSRAIVELLKASEVQFVLTTHNTSIMTNDLLRPDCYFLMWPNKIQSLAASTAKELREAHNIEKMYKAGAFYE